MLARASYVAVSSAVGTLRLRGVVFLIWIALVCAGPAAAGTFTAFGPRVYTRRTATPVTVRNAFNVSNPSTQYTIRIRVNGVASAVVSMNGVEIARPSDFNA